MTKTMDEILTALSAPLDVSRVKYRSSSDRTIGGSQVPYLEGYDVIDMANKIFAYQWSFDTLEVKIERWEQVVTEWDNQARKKVVVLDPEGNPVKKPAGIVYVRGKVSVQIDGTWFEHGDIGRSVIEGDAPQAIDTALAGAATDCMKRCFRQLGTQFGNSLYDKEERQEIQNEVGGNAGGNGQRAGGSNGQQRTTTPPRQGAGTQPRQGATGQRTATRPEPTTNPPAAQPASTTTATITVEQPKGMTLEQAKSVKVPKNLPMAGSTLGELAKSPDLFSRSALHWYTGEWKRQSGDKDVFHPQDVDEEHLMAAAKLVWPTVPQS